MSYDSVILADSPIAFYPGEASGVTADNLGTAGSAIDGSYVGSPTMGVAGPTGDATAFTAASGKYLSVASNAALDLGDGSQSLEFWFKWGTVANWQDYGLIEKGTNGWEMWFTSNGSAQGLFFFGQLGQGMGCATDGYPITDTNWHYIVGTKVTGTSGWKIYLDGTDRTTAKTAVVLATTTTAFTVGYDASYPALGSFAKIAVYGAVLTPTQVAAHYAAASATPSGLFLMLENGSGAYELEDSSGGIKLETA
jgi:hypothetical protein